MKAVLQSMTTRVFLILFVGVLVSVLVTVGLALSERKRMIMQFREFHAVERVAQFILSLEPVPAHSRTQFFFTAGRGELQAEPASPNDEVLQQQSELAVLLEQRLPDDYAVASTPTAPTDCTAPRRLQRRPAEQRAGCVALLVTLQDGTRLRISVSPPREPRLGPRINLSTYGPLFLLSIAVLAAVVARMSMAPLKRLARAATELGQDIERPPLPERGAVEIRQATAAFNAMQSRIRNHIKQRAHILAAITHDLQTPLTRLRLRLEKVDDAELREKLIGDLSAMQGMVREGLELARSMNTTEPLQLLDLDSLVDSVCSDATDAGQPVTSCGRTNASLMALPLALRRCLTNLIDNAVKYGRFAELTSSREDETVAIRVRDGGSGIPEDEMEKVFDPFYRLESSRSRDTGGTGLGLTIARNIAEQHGGSIHLRNHPTGGLEVTLRLPLPKQK